MDPPKLRTTDLPLVGREQEAAILRDLRHQITLPQSSSPLSPSTVRTGTRKSAAGALRSNGSGTRVLVVHGSSGSGKTALCRQVLFSESTTNNSNTPSEKTPKVFCLAGKFEQYTDFASPYSALVEALDSLGHQILADCQRQGHTQHCRNGTCDLIGVMQECLSLEGGTILAHLVPSFQDIVNMPQQQRPEKVTKKYQKSYNRSKLERPVQRTKSAMRVTRMANRAIPGMAENGKSKVKRSATSEGLTSRHGIQDNPAVTTSSATSPPSNSDSKQSTFNNGYSLPQTSSVSQSSVKQLEPIRLGSTEPSLVSNDSISDDSSGSSSSSSSSTGEKDRPSFQTMSQIIDQPQEQAESTTPSTAVTHSLPSPALLTTSSLLEDSDSSANGEVERETQHNFNNATAISHASLSNSGTEGCESRISIPPPTLLKKSSLIDDSDSDEDASPLISPPSFLGYESESDNIISAPIPMPSLMATASTGNNDSLPIPTLIPLKSTDAFPMIPLTSSASNGLPMPSLSSKKKSLLMSDSDSDHEDAEQAELDAAIRISMLYHQKQHKEKQEKQQYSKNGKRWSLEKGMPVGENEIMPPPPPLMMGEQTFFQKASERLAVALGVFLTKFCNHDRPLILFMDDVQWSDQNSMDLLALIANDTIISNLLLVVSFRDSDNQPRIDNNGSASGGSEGNNHPTTPPSPRQRFQAQLFTKGEIPEIHVTDLSLAGVQAMVSNILQFRDNDNPDRSSYLLELSKVVYRKTLGSPYFVVQFLQLLVVEGLLRFSYAAMEWQWDDVSLVRDMMNVSDNVVSVVLKRMESLPVRALRPLALAAYVGFYTSLDLLEALYQRKDIQQNLNLALLLGKDISDDETPIFGLRSMLEIAANEGFVEIEGNVLRFAHDRVQETAYSLISSPDSQSILHWIIGHAVNDIFVKQDGLQFGESYIFVAADQLNRGSSGIKSTDQRHELIRLNWQASQVAGNKSSADLMADFLLKAIALAKEEDWTYSNAMYVLLLEIFTRTVEVEASRGNLNESQEIATAVLSHIRRPEDGRGARIARAHAYGWSMQWDKAIEEARQVLSLCGVSLESSNTKAVKKQFARVKRLVERRSDNELLQLPPMTDELKISAMKMLKFGIPFGFAVDADFANLCKLKMMELTLVYGHLRETGGFALSGFGCVLANIAEKEKKEAYRFSRLALKMPGDKTSIPGTALNVYNYLSHIQQPTFGSLEPTLAAYRTGVEVGDMAFGGICVSLYSLLYIMNGLPLDPFMQELKKIAGQLKLFQQDFCNLYVVQCFQFASCISSKDERELFPLTWESIAQHGFFPKTMDLHKLTEGQPARTSLLYLRIFERYIMNDWSALRVELKKVFVMKSRHFPGYHFMNLFFYLIEGLAGVALFRVTKKAKFKSQAKTAIEELQSAAVDGSSDALLFLQLLKALVSTISSKKPALQEIRKKFENSISQLSRAGFLHVAAIANERLGELMATQKEEDDDHHWSRHYLERAAVVYHEWGANKKVQDLQHRYDFIGKSERFTKSFSRVRLRRQDSSDTSKSFRDLEKSLASGTFSALPGNALDWSA